MKITIQIEETRHACTMPYDGADHVLSSVALPCGCETRKIGGRGMTLESRDTYRAKAGCMVCGADVGTLRVEVSTVFGIEEDERVLNGRCRVH